METWLELFMLQEPIIISKKPFSRAFLYRDEAKTARVLVISEKQSQNSWRRFSSMR